MLLSQQILQTHQSAKKPLQTIFLTHLIPHLHLLSITSSGRGTSEANQINKINNPTSQRRDDCSRLCPVEESGRKPGDSGPWEGGVEGDGQAEVPINVGREEIINELTKSIETSRMDMKKLSKDINIIIEKQINKQQMK